MCDEDLPRLVAPASSTSLDAFEQLTRQRISIRDFAYGAQLGRQDQQGATVTQGALSALFAAVEEHGIIEQTTTTEDLAIGYGCCNASVDEALYDHKALLALCDAVAIESTVLLQRVNEAPSDQSRLSKLFMAVEQQWRLLPQPIEYDVTPTGDGDVECGQEWGRAEDLDDRKIKCRYYWLYADLRHLCEGPLVCLDDEDCQRTWAPVDAVLLIEPAGMDTSALVKVWKDDIELRTLPNKVLVPIRYDDEPGRFQDLTAVAGTIMKYTGHRRRETQPMHDGAQIPSLPALQRYLSNVGEEAARSRSLGTAKRCDAKHNYIEFESPLARTHLKSKVTSAFREVTKEHANARRQLNGQKMQADINKDTAEAARIGKQRRFLNKQMFNEAADRVAMRIQIPFLAEEEVAVKEVADLYTLFEAHRAILIREDLNAVEAFRAYERVQERMMTTVTTLMNKQVNSVEKFLSVSGGLVRKAATRVRRVSAVDIEDREVQAIIAKKRLSTDSGARMVCMTVQELQVVKCLLDCSRRSVTVVERALDDYTLDMRVLAHDFDIWAAQVHGIDCVGRFSTYSLESEDVAFERHKTRVLSTIDEEGARSDD